VPSRQARSFGPDRGPKWRPTLAAAHTPSSISSSEPSSNNPSKGPSSNRFSYTHSPLFPQHSSRSAASLSASPSTDTDSRRGTSALDPLPLHTLRSLSDNPVRFLRGPASFSRPTPLLGVPSLSLSNRASRHASCPSTSQGGVPTVVPGGLSA